MAGRRDSLASIQPVGLVEDQLSNTPFHISTPFRLLRTPHTNALTMNTPLATKFPLVSYVESHFGPEDSSIRLAARRVSSYMVQQNMIARLESVEHYYELKKDFIPAPNLSLVLDLRRQYALAVLRQCEEQEIAEIAAAFEIQIESGAMECLPKTPLKLSYNGEEASEIGKPSVNDENDETRADDDVFNVCLDENLCSADLSEVAEASPVEVTPSIGFTPLNKMRRNHLNRLRVNLLKKYIVNESEEVQAAARRRISALDGDAAATEDLYNVVNSIVYNSVRKRKRKNSSTPMRKARRGSNVSTGAPSTAGHGLTSQRVSPSALSLRDVGSDADDIKAGTPLALTSEPVTPSNPPTNNYPTETPIFDQLARVGSETFEHSARIMVSAEPESLAARRQRRAATKTVRYTPTGVTFVEPPGQQMGRPESGKHLQPPKAQRNLSALTAGSKQKAAGKSAGVRDRTCADKRVLDEAESRVERLLKPNLSKHQSAEGAETDSESTQKLSLRERGARKAPAKSRGENGRRANGSAVGARRSASRSSTSSSINSSDSWSESEDGCSVDGCSVDVDDLVENVPAAGAKDERKQMGTVQSAGATKSTCTSSSLDDEFKNLKRGGFASLLGVRGAAAKGNRYQSRTSVAAKARYTREKRILRKAQEHKHYEDTGEFRQETRRERRLTQYAQSAEQKYLATCSSSAQLETYRTVLAAEARAAVREASWEKLLAQFYHVHTWRRAQKESIERLWATDRPQPLLLALPTGGGKTCVFFLSAVKAAVDLGALSVMVLPTKALVLDQFRIAQGMFQGILNTARLHSGMEAYEYALTLTLLQDGSLDILFTTPEQFTSVSINALLRRAHRRRLGLLCLDEAHCLSEWSHTFRPAYQDVLGSTQRHFPQAKILLLTATITHQTEASVAGNAANGLAVIKPNSGLLRNDISIEVKGFNHVSGSLPYVSQMIKAERSGWKDSGLPNTHLVFVWMKHQAEQVCRSLKEEFPDASIFFYHSGVSDQEKERIHRKLNDGSTDILVATQALGLGINVASVTNVYHLSMPSSIEQWLQEMGRCNRELTVESATCYSVVVEEEYVRRRQRTQSNLADFISIRRFLRILMQPWSVTKPRRAGGPQLSYLASGHVVLAPVGSAKKTRDTIGAEPDAVVRLEGKNSVMSLAPVKRVLKALNASSDEELGVLSAIIERACRLSAGRPPGPPTWPGHQQWQECLHEWQSEDDYTHAQYAWCMLADLELRCFRTPLDEIQHGVLHWLRSTIWKDKPSQGVYKLRWADILFDHDACDVRHIHPFVLRDMLYRQCQAEMVSVKPAPLRHIYFITYFPDAAEATELSVNTRDLQTAPPPPPSLQSLEQNAVQEIEQSLLHNSQAQVRKVDALYAAMRIRQLRGHNAFKEFIHDYFYNPDAQWPPPCIVNDPELLTLTTQPIKQLRSVAEKASFRADVRALCDHAEGPLRKAVVVDPYAVECGRDWVTPTVLARVLCGFAPPGWEKAPAHSRYAAVAFESVLQECFTVLGEVHKQYSLS